MAGRLYLFRSLQDRKIYTQTGIYGPAILCLLDRGWLDCRELPRQTECRPRDYGLWDGI